MLAEQKASGLSIRDFCLRKGISKTTFYYRQRRATAKISRRRRSSRGGFASLRLQPLSNGGAGYEITQGQATLRLPENFNPEKARILWEMLRP